MNTHPIAAAALAALALSLGAGAADAGQACYRKVATPALYQTVTEQVVVEPARVIARTVPAEYEQVSQHVLVRPARVFARYIPAVTQTVLPATICHCAEFFVVLVRVSPFNGHILIFFF